MLIEGVSKPSFRLDRTAKDWGILFYIREDIPCKYIKQATLNKSFERFFWRTKFEKQKMAFWMLI